MGDRRFFLIFGTVYFVLGSAVVISALLLRWVRSWSDAFAILPLGFLWGCAGLMFVRMYWRNILVLSDEAVGTEQYLGFNELKRNAVAGKRFRQGKHGIQTLILPADPHGEILVIHPGFVVDDYYQAWVDSLPVIRSKWDKLMWGE